MHPFKLRQLKAHLTQGAVIAYPTETVWGLGCLPNQHSALEYLADIKQRSLSKGFILVSPNIDYCLPFIDAKYHDLAKKNITLNLKNPTTWLVPKSLQLSSLISGQFSTVAIRISPHPFVKQACEALESPLVSTSANRRARPSLNSTLLVERFLGDRIHFIVKGYPDGSGTASTIINCQNKQIIRA